VSLGKQELLQVFGKLLDHQPSLRPLVLSFLPPPSLETFATTLAELEKRTVDSVPRGVNLREEYIWGRVRGQLEEYVSESRHFLGVFCPTLASAEGGGVAQHPSDTFSFLFTLSSSIRRIESLLPRPALVSNAHQFRLNPNDPLSSHLLPLVINQWHVFATRLSVAVNKEGRILSADTVRGWFRQLQHLSESAPRSQTLDASIMQQRGGSDSVARRAMEGVRERFAKEIGWTVGMRATTSVSQPVAEDEEL
jgi:Cut8, nuclear proteasome tether protein